MMVAVAHREWRGVTQRLLAMAVFLMATRCGFLLATTRRSNVWLVLTQTVLLLPLLLLHATISHLPILGIALCCAALGLQNGVVTTAGGVNLHSTFVSGDLTKLLKPVSSPAASATSTAPRALLPWLIVGFATGALGAAASSPRPRLLSSAWVFLAGLHRSGSHSIQAHLANYSEQLALRHTSS